MSSSSSAPSMPAPEANTNPMANTPPADTTNPEVPTNPSDTTSNPSATTTSNNSKTARVRTVHTRALVDFTDSRELAQVMLDAVTAHKHLYEDAGILHGDINPNTIAIFAFPDGDGARSVGGLIDCDEPLRTVKV